MRLCRDEGSFVYVSVRASILDLRVCAGWFLFRVGYRSWNLRLWNLDLFLPCVSYAMGPQIVAV